MFGKLKSYSKPVQMSIVGVSIVVLLAGGWVAWWLGSPIFLSGNSSNEDISEFDNFTTIPTSNNITSNSSSTTTTTSETTTTSDGNGLVLLGQGEFVRIDNSHWGTGLVRVFQSSTGVKSLVFVKVEIANGPSLKVYLSTKNSFSGIKDDPGSYVDLGDLKANKGNFTMDIPPSTDLSLYNSILIWCDPFAVVFTWATLG